MNGTFSAFFFPLELSPANPNCRLGRSGDEGYGDYDSDLGSSRGPWPRIDNCRDYDSPYQMMTHADPEVDLPVSGDILPKLSKGSYRRGKSVQSPMFGSPSQGDGPTGIQGITAKRGDNQILASGI
ncbi:uncharacterized protein N7459_009119 [Penicillium hispanicum]|uniref:Uncharacterized protein n=1 Tax=Penicillium cinerascens TaxID=70096 RepID=A0A9W9TA44_9EURO|nr:uncharacterized protein N7459_009119 [Penicillium hispanicum]XP_058311006.1 uncharacterized protein N7498_001600 [Penicillium cinerascens]KAJ5215193.1 hypothetical protein N7498_001600 [Penicillium cinerascens]KAJ5569689.1 hypothetical protein N7459_009119 [Penicillium hispanicum]